MFWDWALSLRIGRWPKQFVDQSCCVRGVPLSQEIGKNRILYRGGNNVHTDRQYVIGNVPPDGYRTQIHSGCHCNEMAALHNRHMSGGPKADEAYVYAGFTKLRKKITFKSERASLEDVIGAYSAAKRGRYVAAAAKLHQTGWQDKLANVQMFVKPDRYPVGVIREKAPRAIQYRTAGFNLLLAGWLKNFEHDFYTRVVSSQGTRHVFKGLNPRQRAVEFTRKIAAFADPAFICLDHSRFDSTITQYHLRQTHRIYNHALGKGGNYLYRKQLVNKGYTKNGIRYRTIGTRCSGDFDTGLGNSIINMACILQVFEGVKCDFMLDGDDAVVIVEDSDLNKVDLSGFARFGFNTKCSIVKDVHQVEFCQSRLVWNEGWVFSRNPLRAISNMQASRKMYRPVVYAQYLAGVGRCELACSSGIPILQAAAVRAMRVSDRWFVTDKDRWKMRQGAVEEKPISALTRITFMKSWGISPSVQQSLEAFYALPHWLSVNSKFKLVARYDVKSLLRSWTWLGSLGRAGIGDCWSAGERSLTGLFAAPNLCAAASLPTTNCCPAAYATDAAATWHVPWEREGPRWPGSEG